MGLTYIEPGINWDAVQSFFDVVGIFDPTPCVDAANGVGYAARGRWADAGLSLISVVPLLGDLIGKGGKLGLRGAEAAATAAKSVDTAESAARTARSAHAGTQAARGAHAASEAVHMHHLLPKAFESRFAKVGLDIEKFKIPLPAGEHICNPKGIHTNLAGNWNRRWEEFFERHERARRTPTRKEALDFMNQLRREFGI